MMDVLCIITNYPVRCTQSRHRAFLLASLLDNFCFCGSFLQWDFLVFGKQKALFLVILGARGHLLEARASILTICGFVVILGAFGNEKVIPFGDKNLTTTLLLGVLDFWCFIDMFFYLVFLIFGGRRLHFRHHFGTFWEAPGCPK